MNIREEDGLLSKEQLCRSVQAETLRILQPIAKHEKCFSHFPRAACGSLLKAKRSRNLG